MRAATVVIGIFFYAFGCSPLLTHPPPFPYFTGKNGSLHKVIRMHYRSWTSKAGEGRMTSYQVQLTQSGTQDWKVSFFSEHPFAKCMPQDSGLIQDVNMPLSVVYDKLPWVPHLLDLKKSFAKKLDLIRRLRFLPKDVLINFYFKVILPSVTYSLVLWGSCFNADVFCSLERLHCRAARIIFNLPMDMRSLDVLRQVDSHPLSYSYKLVLLKLMHKAFNFMISSHKCYQITLWWNVLQVILYEHQTL